MRNEEDEFSLGDANKSYCEFECQWLVTFVVILSVGKLVSATGRVGNALVNLRYVYIVMCITVTTRKCG